MCYNKIGVGAHNIITTVGLLVNMIGRVNVIASKETKPPRWPSITLHLNSKFEIWNDESTWIATAKWMRKFLVQPNMQYHFGVKSAHNKATHLTTLLILQRCIQHIEWEHKKVNTNYHIRAYLSSIQPKILPPCRFVADSSKVNWARLARIQTKCGEYSTKDCQSHITLLWICIMLWIPVSNKVLKYLTSATTHTIWGLYFLFLRWMNMREVQSYNAIRAVAHTWQFQNYSMALHI